MQGCLLGGGVNRSSESPPQLEQQLDLQRDLEIGLRHTWGLQWLMGLCSLLAHLESVLFGGLLKA